MSKSETEKNPNAITKTYRFLNLDTMKMEEATGTTEFIGAEDFASATSRIGNDEKAITAAINAYLKRQELKALKARTLPANAGNKTVVMSLAKPFRAMPPYDTIEPRAKQTEAILEFFGSVPKIVNQIKEASAKLAADGVDDDEDNDE